MPDVSDEPESNPECTTTNAKACNDNLGFWDYIECTCTYPSLDPIDEEATDETDDGFEFDEDFGHSKEEESVADISHDLLSEYTSLK